MASIFTKIINKKLDGFIIYEDKHTVCIFPKDMEVYGHLLVISKVEYNSIFDIPDELLNHISNTTKKMSFLLKEKLGATGVNLLHASGADAGQSVPHFHIHILPRFKDDGLDTWPTLKEIKVNKEELFKKLIEK